MQWLSPHLGEAGSFDAFRDRVIEDQLKKRYVKDLLALLHAQGVSLVDTAAGVKLVSVLELVLRRNVHVHNRGIVDARYLEADPATGTPKYNLFNLKPGAVAVIDAAYFQSAIRLCTDCVRGVATWSRG